MKVSITFEDSEDLQTIIVTPEGLEGFTHPRNYTLTNSKAARTALCCLALVHKLLRQTQKSPDRAHKMQRELTGWVREMFKETMETKEQEIGMPSDV